MDIFQWIGQAKQIDDGRILWGYQHARLYSLRNCLKAGNIREEHSAGM